MRRILTQRVIGITNCASTRPLRVASIAVKEQRTMKRVIAALLIAGSLPFAACTTTVVARPPAAGMVLVEGRWIYPPRAGAIWVAGHYERRAFHRVWIGGHWR